MPYGIYIILFILGLALGSFVNVLSLRYKPGNKLFDFKIIGGRSHCRDCGKTLCAFELIPLLSFVSQKGKCRNCGIRLLRQYPLVEFLAGLIFVFVPFRFFGFNFFPSPFYFLLAVIWTLIFLLFLLLSIIDLREMVIPDEINLILTGCGAILGFATFYFGKFSDYSSQFLSHYALLFGFRDNLLVNYLLAVLLAGVFFGALIYFSRGRAMGLGDLKLSIALALVFGWPEIIFVIAFAFVIGAIVNAPLLLKGARKMKDAVPFGPFLVVASALVFFFGYQILDIYFKVFKIY